MGFETARGAGWRRCGAGILCAAALFCLWGRPAAQELETGSQFRDLDAQESEEIFFSTRGQTLASALESISKLIAVAIEPEDLPPRTIKGSFSSRSISGFLDTFTRRAHLDWVYKQGRVIISDRAGRDERRFSFRDEQQAFAFADLLSATHAFTAHRFPSHYDDRDASLTIDAPPQYLTMVAALYEGFSLGDSIVATPDLGGSQETGTMLFRLHHAWAGDKSFALADGTVTRVPGIASLLKDLLATAHTGAAAPPSGTSSGPSGGGQTPLITAAGGATPAAARSGPMILADVRQNAVVIHDRLSKYPQYEALVNDLDQPTRLVEIDAIIVDVAKNRVEELGIQWRGIYGNNAVGFGSLGDQVTAAGSVALSLGAGPLSAALQTTTDSLVTRLRALETQGESRVLSLPSILTLDNLEAVISNNQRFFIRVAGFQDSSVQNVMVGTELRVTPHIIDRSGKTQAVRLLVNISDGEIDNSTSNQIDGLPRLTENMINTQALIENNGSLVIGGHVSREYTKSNAKVPILGDLPLIGPAFRSQEKINREFVRIFIISPRIRGLS